METSSCIECFDDVGELEGWETTSGKVMCAECFTGVHGSTAFWGLAPSGSVAELVRQDLEFLINPLGVEGTAPTTLL